MLKLAGVLLAFVATSVSCGGSAPPPDAPTTVIAAGDDEAGERGAGESDPRAASGGLLQYMPASCPGGRGYVDVAALLSSPGAQMVLREVTGKLLDKQRDDKEVREAIDAVKRSGFDLASGLSEVAMCLGKVDKGHVMAIRTSIDDPLNLLAEVAAAAGDGELLVTNIRGMKMVTHEDMALVQPTPGVLVFGDVKRVGQASDREGASGFGPAAEHVGYLNVPVDAARMVVKLTKLGQQFELWGAMRMAGETGAAIAQHPQQVSREMRKQILDAASEFGQGPFRILHQRAQDVQVEASGDTITASVSFSPDDITHLLKAAAPLLGVSLSGSRLAGGSETDTLDELLQLIRNKK